MERDIEKRIPFGLKNGQLVGVDEVESGLACGCICPSCGGELQANKGETRTHYFSHNPNQEQPECETTFESAIHQMAKQILAEEKWIYLPALKVSRSQHDSKGIQHRKQKQAVDETEQTFTHVSLEQQINDIRPDIIAYSGRKAILIEIAVTHFSDKDKRRKIRELEFPSIEIDLSGIDYAATKAELRKLVIEDKKNKKWLSNPAAISVIAEIETSLSSHTEAVNSKYESEQIAEQQRKAKLRALYVKKQAEAEISNPPVQRGHTKEYDPRWFDCEVCRHLFSRPLSEAPYSLSTITCPECGHEISTHKAGDYHA